MNQSVSQANVSLP